MDGSAIASADCGGREVDVMKWIWVRHGQTDMNASGKYLGHYDAFLNQEGSRQAEAAAQQLATVHFQHFYCSDLTRCTQTAAIVGAAHGKSASPVPALRELHFGEWEGRTYDEVLEMDAERLKQWYARPHLISPPGGEMLRHLQQRVDGWLNWLKCGMKQDETAVLVSHGGPIRWFEAKWLEGDAAAFWKVEGVRHGRILAAEWDGHTWRAERL
ncbi:histidine phosphatase family protein [Aneurinibacillus sp. Ricciae_BoGa-3]|uniref:histidine phosphatase family protein n=1 Tax=Aneurinibacillus sp. Ricciae_BoGa-3 TaxID=3022697 RepID=UPI002341639E|nr:histidine phosphatase family protein [Aneurinibacillus sp. Ricciae_BoGa-3]WCK53989.1 histidine phosphatase family protein [Aneurinibacillus sp. Ricciae_BoGa-3]